MDELVEHLSTGLHRVVAARTESAKELKEAIDRGFVLMKFTDTKGGTELGVRLEPADCDYSEADFAVGEGNVVLRGKLTLNFHRVEFSATIDLKTLGGEGCLRTITDDTAACH